jgi:hypothetical protein
MSDRPLFSFKQLAGSNPHGGDHVRSPAFSFKQLVGSNPREGTMSDRPLFLLNN